MQIPSFVGVKWIGPVAGTVRKISLQGPSHRLTSAFPANRRGSFPKSARPKEMHFQRC